MDGKKLEVQRLAGHPGVHVETLFSGEENVERMMREWVYQRRVFVLQKDNAAPYVDPALSEKPLRISFRMADNYADRTWADFIARISDHTDRIVSELPVVNGEDGLKQWLQDVHVTKLVFQENLERGRELQGMDPKVTLEILRLERKTPRKKAPRKGNPVPIEEALRKYGWATDAKTNMMVQSMLRKDRSYRDIVTYLRGSGFAVEIGVLIGLSNRRFGNSKNAFADALQALSNKR
jgi:hypothetical protein